MLTKKLERKYFELKESDEYVIYFFRKGETTILLAFDQCPPHDAWVFSDGDEYEKWGEMYEEKENRISFIVNDDLYEFSPLEAKELFVNGEEWKRVEFSVCTILEEKD